MASAGRLTVELAASIATFQTDLGRAVKTAETNAKQIEKAFQDMQGRMSGFARQIGRDVVAAVGVAAFVHLIKGTIDAQDHLNDLSKSTGVAVETLGGLGFAATQSGSTLDGAGKAIGKLNLQIASAIGGNQEAVTVFKNLGVTLSDLKTKTPVEVFAKVADAFAATEDGAIKASYGNKLFGKAYQEIIPLLDEGGAKLQKNVDYFTKFSGTTAAAVKASDDFNDAMVKMHLLQGRFATTLVADLLPSMQNLVDMLIESKEKSTLFSTAAGDVSSVLKLLAVVGGNVAYVFHAIANEIGGIGAQLVALAHLDFKGFTFIGDEMKKDAAEARKQVDAFNEAILNPKSITREAAAARPKGRPLTPLASGSAGSIDDPTKKILEGALKEIEAILAKESAILKSHNEIRDAYYQAGFISLTDYYNRTEAARDQDIKLQRNAFEKEKALLEARSLGIKVKSSDPDIKQSDREDAKNKIIDLTKKMELAEIEASKQGELGILKRKLATEDYGRTIDEITAKLLEQEGKTGEATALRLKSQGEEVRRKLTSGGDFGAIAKLDTLDARAVSQAKLNDANSEFALILGQVSLKVDQINLAQDTGALSELGALAAISSANQARIGELTIIRDRMLAIAQASGDPRALLAVDELSLRIARLASETDLVGDKFRKIFRDDFADGLTDVINGTKTLSQAFKSMTNSIVQQINRIVANSLSDALFKNSGALGKDGGFDIGGWFGKLFSGGGGAASSSGGFNIDAMFAASGTNFSPGGLTLVGEKGPEVMNVPRGAQIIPNSVLKSARAERATNVTVIVNVPQGTSGPSASQIGLETANSVRRVVGRDG